MHLLNLKSRNVEVPVSSKVSVSNPKILKVQGTLYGNLGTWLPSCHQVLVIELQFFKQAKYVYSINQMRLF